MFLGIHEPELDGEGCMFLPAKLREDMKDGIILTRGQEHCICAFPASQFEEMTKGLVNASLSSKQARDWIRVILSGTYKEVSDRQGHISVLTDLRICTSLDRKLTVTDAGSRAEVWNVKAWHEYLAVQEEVFSQTAGEIAPGIF